MIPKSLESNFIVMNTHTRPVFSNLIQCILFLLLALPSSLRAGLLYSKVGNTITITGSNPRATGILVIPATLGNLPVTSIGNGAFGGCEGLTSVILPSSVTSIGDWAFWNCWQLPTITLGSGLTSIGESAFEECSGLITVTLPNKVSSIGGGAFYGCSRLASIAIPDSVAFIGELAFFGCSGLTGFTVGGNNLAYSSRDGILFNKAQTSLVAFPAGLTGVYAIPDTITSIGELAFIGCSGLTGFTVGGNNPAYGSLEGVLFNKARTSLVAFPPGWIGNYHLPDSVTSIGGLAFVGCDDLTGFAVGGNNLAFSSREGVLLNKAQTSLVAFPAGMTGGYTIPDSITSIGELAFFGRTGLTSLILPDSLTSIGEGSFEDCSGLTNVTIGKNITSIGNYAFENCSGLTSITIPKNVTSIGEGAFIYCFGLTSVTIGSGVKSIGDSAFEGCEGLTSVYFQGDAPGIGNGVFHESPNLTIYYNPSKIGWSTTFAGRPTARLVTPPTLQTNYDPIRNEVVFVVNDGEGNTEYLVEHSDDLKQWSPLSYTFTGSLNLYELDPQAGTRPFRFYRVIQR